MAFPHHAIPTSRQKDLRIRQLDLLYEYSRLPQWLIMLAALVTSVLVWDHVAHHLLIGWLLSLVVLALLRSQLVKRYHAANDTHRLRLRWRAMFYLGNLLTGLSLGIAQILMVPLDNFTVQAPVYGLASGAGICVAVIYANRFLAFATFVIPAFVPATIYLISQDDPTSPYWGMMGITLFGCILLAGAFVNRSSLRALVASEHSNALVTRLEEARVQAEGLNQQLAREIQQRRQAEQNLRESHDILEQRVEQRTAELEEAGHALRSNQAQLSLALEASELGLWDWDLASDRVYHSHVEEIFGLSADAVRSMEQDLRPLVHPDDAEPVRQALVRHLKDQTSAYRIEYRVRHADGRWVWVEDSGRAVERDDQGRVLRMIGTRRDITPRRHQAEAAQLAATVFEATSEGIFILDPQLNILTVNKAFSVITGYSADDAIGRRIINMGMEKDREDFDRLRKVLHDQDRWQGERIGQRRSGEQYPQWLQLAVVRDAHGQLTHYVGFFADLTTRRQTEEQVRYLTNYDPLTQLANRNLFTQRLSETTGRARKSGEQLAVMHIDLDRFKYINDTLGHDVADQLLRTVAKRLNDLVPDAEILARLSADEFVVIVEQRTAKDELVRLAEQLLEGLKHPVTIDGHELVVTASIGISQFPQTARDALLMITQANQAMQHAKHLGGNSFQFFTRDLQSYSLERLQLENQLRKALDENQLVVHYQPKLHLASDRIRSAEALVRWKHPQRGLIMPGEFIEMAEETGLILALGDIVLQQACAQASRWYHQGPTAIAVAVNLSVQQLRQSQFAQRVKGILEECDLPASMLELELTESMLLEHSDEVTRNVAELQEMGIRLSVDDFGTGYSSLAYLKRFPLHTLKIDRTFVSGLDEEGRDAAIVCAIIAMSHSLGLNVVAEGVEHHSQLAFLKANGCDEVQGYLISRPLPAREFTALLDSESSTSPTH
ncbi:diguanylate cyclase/phosphodiesterase with PAS/PAC sensor(s) [Halopseudomonas xinjiangensis]|uniref:cyclic-guanylate-specific phosphodiesterase n=1 Tax=Halopseudomonas xinjiangensis TaxID=487184 RepID=A0A1H1XMC8_9GAMM|nr:GGDEF domain-containing phosphodiesterase [Halopseudomonas xinjiangensis]SDT09979.1 diguanylate cyclase/phosphodiesterase with PAS/PAC sensor(s) [Halopseudomonas xinjiangensis]